MQEEFHGIRNADNTATIEWKVLYKWGTINASIWLPSLSELVGYDPNSYYEPHGTYYSAMQGMNTSNVDYYVDAQGGVQFAYFQQFNASGGGERIWNICSQQQSWLRSIAFANSFAAWLTNGIQRMDWMAATNSCAVHPARRCKFHIPRTGFRCRNDRK